MSFSENLQYNVALPGAEFRARDLSVPAIAAKTVYEIDFGWGTNKQFCLSILFEAFRGVDRVTQILNESSHLFQKGAPRKPEWQMEVIRARVARALIIDRKMSSLGENIKGFERSLLKLVRKEENLRMELTEEDVEVREITPPPGEDEEGKLVPESPVTPKPVKKVLFQATKKYEMIVGQIATERKAIEDAEEEFALLAAESSGYKADPLNHAFSENDEKWGKGVVQSRGGEVMDEGGEGGRGVEESTREDIDGSGKGGSGQESRPEGRTDGHSGNRGGLAGKSLSDGACDRDRKSVEVC
jgi:hypothetical protein